MKENSHQKLIFSTSLVLVSFLLSYGYYLEFVQGLTPCPLCSIQRLCYFMIGLISFVALVHKPDDFGYAIYTYSCGVFSGAGFAVAGRQVWLQHLPTEKLPECGPDLSYLLEVHGLFESLGVIFYGTGDCATVKWEFLNFSIAEWSLLWFLFLTTLYVIDRIKAKSVTPQ
tara:strand:- start:11 stop:520 length:510 start_codon:yes stop_codon:yes gene_type:complete